MEENKQGNPLGELIIILAYLMISGLIIMLGWNYIISTIFNEPNLQINFWEAVLFRLVGTSIFASKQYK